ncbi:CDP-glycerol glycerophosphotransferase family protein [Streptomyces pyxinae]
MRIPTPTPTLSVVVSGTAPLSLLRDCLASVTGQWQPGLDIVVAVTDATARALARDHLPNDPRVTLVTVPSSTGPAGARAAGARAATGTHLQFLRAADRLPPGTAAELTDRLARLSGPGAAPEPPPDLLLCDHRRTLWGEPAAPGGDGAVLERPGGTATTVARRPDLLELPPVLGTRIVAAALLAEHPELLGSGDEDELYLAYALPLLARSISCCSTVALVRRPERPAQRRAAGPERHLAVFDQYERLHRLAAAAGLSAAPRARLYDRMVTDHLATLARRDELPPALLTDYFRRAAAQAARFRPEGHRGPGGLEGVRRGLLGQDAYLGYRLLRAANDRRRAALAVAAGAGRRLAALGGAHRYRRALRRRADEDLAVFSAYWNRGVHCNPAAIAAELAELAPDIRRVWIVEEDRVELLPPGTEYAVPGTARYWEVLGRATYLVNNVNFANGVVKRPGSVHLQTHHGTPLKRMGLDQSGHPAAARGFDFASLMERVDRWDYSLSANRHSTETWQRAYPSGYRSLDYGYPRNDVYYRATAADVRAARARLGIAPGQRALLYAPTHRDWEAGWTPRLDLPRLADRLGEDTVLLARGHYFHAGPPFHAGQGAHGGPPFHGGRAGYTGSGGQAGPAAFRHPRVLDVTGWEPVEELCLAADALITDYSSLMFDYANLDRPILIHADDWETYTRVRGVCFDLTAEPPGPVTRDQEELAAVLGDDTWCGEAAAKLRHDFRLRFCEYDDGRAAERVVRRVFLGEGEETLPPVLPPHRRTPAPTPEEAQRP